MPGKLGRGTLEARRDGSRPRPRSKNRRAQKTVFEQKAVTCDTVLVQVRTFSSANRKLCFTGMKTHAGISGRNFCFRVSLFTCLSNWTERRDRVGFLFYASPQAIPAAGRHPLSWTTLEEYGSHFFFTFLFSSLYTQCFYSQVATLKILT